MSTQASELVFTFLKSLNGQWLHYGVEWDGDTPDAIIGHKMIVTVSFNPDTGHFSMAYRKEVSVDFTVAYNPRLDKVVIRDFYNAPLFVGDACQFGLASKTEDQLGYLHFYKDEGESILIKSFVYDAPHPDCVSYSYCSWLKKLPQIKS